MDGFIPYLGPAVGIMMSSMMSMNSTSPSDIAQSLVERIPGFADAQQLIIRTTGVDILYLALGILLFDALRRVLKYLYATVDGVLVSFLMSDISIDANDEIRDEILSWFASRRNKKKFGARSVMIFSGALKQKRMRYPYLEDRMQVREDKDTDINFIPSLGRHYFFPLGWRPFIFEREGKEFTKGWGQQASQDITIRCFGWSDAPLREFLMLCKEFKKQQSKGRTLTYNFNNGPSGYSEGGSWGSPYAAPSRPLSTVELDQHIKEDIIDDITRYLNPKTADFYKNNGIPWRRGYLLHGPPGTGKSSLSKALAGYFDLALYCMNLGEEGIGDRDLRAAFNALPTKCIVLLEDIDSAGIGREKPQQSNEEKRAMEAAKAAGLFPGAVDTENLDDYLIRPTTSRITLSGLLNALDGASASEGRIVIMTSNNPEVLDNALIRPGRVDKRILLPDMSRTSAEKIFARMYSHTGNDHLVDLAAAFVSRLPEGKITPAELQGFILDRMDDPRKAVEEVEAWSKRIVEEKDKEKEKKAAKSVARKVAAAQKAGTASGSPGALQPLPFPLPMPNGMSCDNHLANGTATPHKETNGVKEKKKKRNKKVFKKSKLGERVVVKKEKDGEADWVSAA